MLRRISKSRHIDCSRQIIWRPTCSWRLFLRPRSLVLPPPVNHILVRAWKFITYLCCATQRCMETARMWADLSWSSSLFWVLGAFQTCSGSNSLCHNPAWPRVCPRKVVLYKCSCIYQRNRWFWVPMCSWDYVDVLHSDHFDRPTLSTELNWRPNRPWWNQNRGLISNSLRPPLTSHNFKPLGLTRCTEVWWTKVACLTPVYVLPCLINCH